MIYDILVGIFICTISYGDSLWILHDLSTYMYVYIYIYIYVYTYDLYIIYVCVYVSIRMYVSRRRYICIYMFIYTGYVNICSCIYIYTCIYT